MEQKEQRIKMVTVKRVKPRKSMDPRSPQSMQGIGLTHLIPEALAKNARLMESEGYVIVPDAPKPPQKAAPKPEPVAEPVAETQAETPEPKPVKPRTTRKPRPKKA